MTNATIDRSGQWSAVPGPASEDAATVVVTDLWRVFRTIDNVPDDVMATVKSLARTVVPGRTGEVTITGSTPASTDHGAEITLSIRTNPDSTGGTPRWGPGTSSRSGDFVATRLDREVNGPDGRLHRVEVTVRATDPNLTRDNISEKQVSHARTTALRAVGPAIPSDLRRARIVSKDPGSDGHLEIVYLVRRHHGGLK